MNINQLKHRLRGSMRFARGVNPFREWILGIVLSALLLGVGLWYTGEQFLAAYRDEATATDASAAGIVYNTKQVSGVLNAYSSSKAHTDAFESGLPTEVIPTVATSTPVASTTKKGGVAHPGPLKVE